MSSLRGFDTPPAEVWEFLEKRGVPRAACRLAAHADLAPSGDFADVWAFATDDALVTACMEDGSFARWPYDEVEEVTTEAYLTTGCLLVRRKDGEFPALCFTNTCRATLGHFARLTDKLRRGEALCDDDFDRGRADTACPKCGTPYRDRNRRVCPKCQSGRAVFLRVLGYTPRYKKEIALVFALILLSAAVNLLRPYLSGRTMYDDVLTAGGKYHGAIWQFVALMVVMELISLAVRIVQGRVGASVSGKIIYDIKVEVFGAMQRLSMSFFNSQHTGSLMNRVNNDALDIQYFLNDGLPNFVINALTILGVGGAVVMFNPVLAGLILLPIPVIVYVIVRVVPRFRKLKWLGWMKSSRLNSVINDGLSGARVVKAFGKEESEVDRFKTASGDLYDNRLREGYKAARIFPALNYLMTIGSLFVWGYGGNLVLEGKMTFGILMTFIGYVGMLYAPIDFMIRTFEWWQDCMNSARRIFEVLDCTKTIPESPNPVHMPQLRGEIDLRHVTFSYEVNKPVLHDVTLHIDAGEMIGLVGHSGAGKSTITNIITRLYDIDEGSLTIDGVPIRDIALDDLHGQIGMVLQETYLFGGTIAENIAYARPDASRAEIVAAAKLANAHDFIMNLPDGYETEIGRRKTNLSGGERQRISIARAILLDPPILILDEATASLDTETEQLIQEALDRLTRSRTTIAIAHRLSTLKNADRLVVVERGEIVEVGTHQELEEKGGVYSKMLGIQREALKIHGVAPEEVS